MRKVIWKLFEIWPSAEVSAGADDETMVIVEKLIQPLGLFRKRTIAIKRFSQEYLEADVSNVNADMICAALSPCGLNALSCCTLSSKHLHVTLQFMPEAVLRSRVPPNLDATSAQSVLTLIMLPLDEKQVNLLL